eukprot:3102997-Lingulodinium_polyedra.AAC.1
MRAHPRLLGRQTAHPGWCKLPADWHEQTSFRVIQGNALVHNLVGRRPGDPLADTVFALAFLAFQRRLMATPEAAGAALWTV